MISTNFKYVDTIWQAKPKLCRGQLLALHPQPLGRATRWNDGQGAMEGSKGREDGTRSGEWTPGRRRETQRSCDREGRDGKKKGGCSRRKMQRGQRPGNGRENWDGVLLGAPHLSRQRDQEGGLWGYRDPVSRRGAGERRAGAEEGEGRTGQGMRGEG